MNMSWVKKLRSRHSSVTLTFVNFPQPSGAISLSHLQLGMWDSDLPTGFLTHAALYTQTDGRSLHPNPPPLQQTPSLFCGLFQSTRSDLAGSMWTKERDLKKNTHHTDYFPLVQSYLPDLVHPGAATNQASRSPSPLVVFLHRRSVWRFIQRLFGFGAMMTETASMTNRAISISKTEMKTGRSNETKRPRRRRLNLTKQIIAHL